MGGLLLAHGQLFFVLRWKRRIVRFVRDWFVGDFVRWALYSRHLLDRCRDPAHPTAKVGDIDQREQQSCDPEKVDVGEEGKKAQYGDNLKLELVRPVRHALRQRVQTQKHQTERQNGPDQEQRRYHR
jgi:hypothetical protein